MAGTKKRPASLIQDTITMNWRDRIVTASGINPGLMLIILLVLWFSGQFINRLIDTPSLDTIKQQTLTISSEHRTQDAQHDLLLKTQERIAETLEVQTFLMTKDDAQRHKYKMDEPRGLRRMQTTP